MVTRQTSYLACKESELYTPWRLTDDLNTWSTMHVYPDTGHKVSAQQKQYGKSAVNHGVIRIGMGVVILYLQVILLLLGPELRFVKLYSGFWCAGFFIITGIISIVSGNIPTSKCMVTCNLSWSILDLLLFTVQLMGLSIWSIISAGLTLLGYIVFGGYILSSLIQFIVDVIAADYSSQALKADKVYTLKF